MKTCTKCGIEKELTEFRLRKKSSDGFSGICKDCCKEKEREYRSKNKPNIKNYAKKYIQKNKEKLRDKNKKYRQENPGKVKEWNNRSKEKKAQWFQENKKRIKDNNLKNKNKKIKYMAEYNKIYYLKNHEEIKKKSHTYKKNRLSIDIDFKIKNNISSLFRAHLSQRKITKSKKIKEYTGIDKIDYVEYFKTTQPEEFNLYLQEGAYHIDHIIPCALYDFTDEEEIKKCWNPNNLRIIPAEENLSKSNKLDLQLVDKYNIKHLLPKIIKETV